MMSTVVATEHPYIVRVDAICGGKPIIKGTRILVRSIVGYYKLGMSIEEILEGLPHLTASQVYDALSYYHDYRAEIDQEIDENKIETSMKTYGLVRDRDGKFVPQRNNE